MKTRKCSAHRVKWNPNPVNTHSNAPIGHIPNENMLLFYFYSGCCSLKTLPIGWPPMTRAKHSHSHTYWDINTHQWSLEVEKTHSDVNKKISAVEEKKMHWCSAIRWSDGRPSTQSNWKAFNRSVTWESSGCWSSVYIEIHPIKLLIKPCLGTQLYSNLVQTSKSMTWCLSLLCLPCTICIMYEHNFH